MSNSNSYDIFLLKNCHSHASNSQIILVPLCKRTTTWQRNKSSEYVILSLLVKFLISHAGLEHEIMPSHLRKGDKFDIRKGEWNVPERFFNGQRLLDNGHLYSKFIIEGHEKRTAILIFKNECNFVRMMACFYYATDCIISKFCFYCVNPICITHFELWQVKTTADCQPTVPAFSRNEHQIRKNNSSSSQPKGSKQAPYTMPRNLNGMHRKTRTVPSLSDFLFVCCYSTVEPNRRHVFLLFYSELQSIMLRSPHPY